MRYLILFILILPLTTYGQEISDLYFFPKKGEFFGQTSLNFSMTELSVGSSSASLKLENDEKKLSQTIAFGINDRFAMFLTLPYAMGGESKLNISGSTSSGDLESESLGIALTLSFLFFDNEMTDHRFGMDLHVSPQGLSERDTGYMGITLRSRSWISETTSWLVSTTFLQYEKTQTTKTYAYSSTLLGLQYFFNENFFLNPHLSVNFEGNTKARDSSFEILYGPRLGGGLAVGGDQGDFMWTISLQHNTGNAEYMESGVIIKGDASTTNFGGSIGYRF